jgi:hypothetical protein
MDAATKPPPVRLGTRPWWAFLLVGVVVLGGLAVLFWFNPTQHSFYPKCMLYAATGIQCPGCGGLRATHALLHGRIEEAFRLNPLLFVLFPLLLYLVIREIAWHLLRKDLPRLFQRPACIWGFLVVVIVFAILRNLPFGPFAWLKN